MLAAILHFTKSKFKMDALKCNLCESFGLKYYSHHIFPYEYLEGKSNSDIWIVGLNPSGPIGYINERKKEDFLNFDPDCHSYFKDFKKVSPKLYTNWKSNNSRIGHTDLVKCRSLKFPPTENHKDKVSIVNNCVAHLKRQIEEHCPKVIICNGSEVCKEMIKFFPPESATFENIKSTTSYSTIFNGQKLWIVLTGFIGRIDDWNKRRLGKEIEHILNVEGIEL